MRSISPVSKQTFLRIPFHMRVCSAFNVIFVQIKLIFDERLRTRPRFETEVQGNTAVVFGLVIVNRLEGVG